MENLGVKEDKWLVQDYTASFRTKGQTPVSSNSEAFFSLPYLPKSLFVFAINFAKNLILLNIQTCFNKQVFYKLKK